MSSIGPLGGGTFADDATIGSEAWANPGNAAVSDDIYASTSIFVSGALPTHYLKVTNFGFPVPTAATMLGVLAEVQRKALFGLINDNSVKLVKGGVISGTDKATGAGWPTTEAYASYGGSTDLWGLSLTPADINDSGFGIVVASSQIVGDQAFIDFIRLTVYFELGSKPAALARRLTTTMRSVDFIS